MIVLEQVEKKYHRGKENEVTALTEINLTIEEGEMVVVTGSSGSGKSTLLHIMGGIDVADQGTYTLFGNKMEKKKEKELARLRNEMFGFVLQNYGLLEYRSVYDNLMVPTLMNKNIKKGQVKKRCKEVLEQVGMGQYLNRKVKELSGGQKQRVAVARALMNQPKIIFADEPTGALDSKNSIMLMEELKKLHEEGKTIVMVTHNEALLPYFKRKIVLKDGKIIQNKEL